MTDVTETDVVVVGLGPGGEAAANKLARGGLEVVGIDERLVGGECPYYGCVPSKMMIRAANTLAESRRVGALAGRAHAEPSWAPVAERIRNEATTDWDDAAAVERLQRSGATFVRGRGRLVGERTVEVDGRRFSGRRGVVLATGTDPGVPPVDGLAGTPYWTNRDIVSLTSLPASIAVIGAGPIGSELAQVFARFGVQVTLLDLADRILVAEEPEASAAVSSALTAEGVRVLPGIALASVSYTEGTFSLDLAGEEPVQAERLLVAAGRTPKLCDVGLETVGLDPEASALRTDGRLRVLRGGAVVDGLYALGDITGEGPYTHTATYQAGILTDHLLGREGPPADYRAMPRVTFTDPEVGAVGLTETQAREQGLDVRVGRARLPETSRGWIHAEGNEGLVKLVVSGDELVGASTVGPAGGEVLAMLTTAIHGRVPVSTLRSMIYAYPTFHGAVRDALSDLG